MLGLDFGGTKIAVAVCDLAGNKIGSAAVQSGGEHGARVSFARGLAAARQLLADAAPGTRLAAVGVSTFGIPLEDGVELAPAINGWGELQLGRELRTEFPGIPVAMTTDAKAAAQAEARWGALAGCDTAVYLNLGTGLSTAVVANGHVVVGSHGAAGEIGYNLRSVADVGLPLDRRTMLEQMVSGQGLSSRAATDSGASSRSRASSDTQASDTKADSDAQASPDGQATAAEIFAAAAADTALAGLVDEFLDELAFHLVNVAILVDPARIAVGGGMVGSWDRIAPRLREALEAGVPYPPELVLAKFPQEAPLLGAVALAIDAAAAAARQAGQAGPAGQAGQASQQHTDSQPARTPQSTQPDHPQPGQVDLASVGATTPAAASWAANAAGPSAPSGRQVQETPGSSSVQLEPSAQMDAQPGTEHGPVASNQGIAV